MANTNQQQLTRTDRRTVIEEIIMDYAARQREERGDNFATASEFEAISQEPLAWLELLGGRDACEVLTDYWNAIR